jgi:hypothetical protein
VSGGGISCPSTCSKTVFSGTKLTLSAVAAAGSRFAGWGGACSGTAPCTLTMDDDRTVTATFNQFPPGYSVVVDESGATPSGSLGGSGSLQGSGQGNVNYGYSQECAASSDGGPFSIGYYPPKTCAQLGRPYSSSGSPERPSGFWFTGNQNCVGAGRPYSGSTFTWHVQLPESGRWHVDVYVPTWTSYGFGNQYVLASDAGQVQNYPLTQQAYHGQWVALFGSSPFTAGRDYTVQLTLADGSDSNCHYQMADQMKWVYDGP